MLPNNFLNFWDVMCPDADYFALGHFACPGLVIDSRLTAGNLDIANQPSRTPTDAVNGCGCLSED